MNNDLLECAIFNLPLTTNDVQMNYHLFQMSVFIRECLSELGLNNLITSKIVIDNFIKENAIQIIYTPSDFKTNKKSIIRVICEKQNYNKSMFIKDLEELKNYER